MIVDVVIIAFMLIFSAIGFKKGFLSTLLSISTFVLSLYLTYSLLPWFTSLLSSIIPIHNIVSSIVGDSGLLSNFINSDNKLYALLRFVLRIDQSALQNTVSSFVLNIVAFITLSFLIKLVLNFLSKMLAKSLKKFFILGTFDRMCGLCFGFLKGLLVISILCIVVYSLNDFSGINAVMGNQIENSVLLPVFNEGTQYVVSTFSQYFF